MCSVKAGKSEMLNCTRVYMLKRVRCDVTGVYRAKWYAILDEDESWEGWGRVKQN